MSLVRRIARPLLAAPFIVEGVRTAQRPERATEISPAAFDQVDKALAKSSLPRSVDSRAIVRGAGVVAACAGLLYASNRAPRLAAALLLGTTTIGLANRKKVWELRGEERLDEVQAILTDAGLLGGVLLAVVDHDGHPSLGYRVNRLVERGQKNAAKKQKQLEKSAGKLSKKASKNVDAATKSVRQTLS